MTGRVVRTLARLLVAGAALLVLGAAPPAAALPDLPDIPIPGFSDCKDAPTLDVPGRGIAGFFSGPPKKLPPTADPFEKDATTTIYEQYGYAGLRWNTYDLGCGPDAMRRPDAVVGTAISNWIMQAPLALTALTGSVTEVAFQPTFLGVFDPITEQVSDALHQNLFVSWIPAVIAILGLLVILRARRNALASTAGAIGWALVVILLATALLRWPLAAGQAADATVTSTLGAVVSKLDGHADVEPGTAVASHIGASLHYRAWLAGTLGSADSATAKKYGPELFKAQALTWSESAEIQKDPESGAKIIEQKRETWKEIASKVQREDPEAYEHLTGTRSETRVGYAALAALGTFLALPFLLLSALLLLGCFLIVRLAVMLFPAFAVLGAFPASRGLVIGLGRTVGSAVVNSIIFGIGAGVTILVIGILFHPGEGTPAWLGLVLMPLFSFVMWVALKPFRRLTAMVSPNDNHFGRMAGSIGSAANTGRSWTKRIALTGLGAAAGGAAGAAAATKVTAEEPSAPPERAEARTGSPVPPQPTHAALPAAKGRHGPPSELALPPAPDPGGAPGSSPEAKHRAGHEVPPAVTPVGAAHEPSALPEGFVPKPTSEGVPAPPTEAEWIEGEDVYAIYVPDANDGPTHDAYPSAEEV